jgi:hypothetical protein
MRSQSKIPNSFFEEYSKELKEAVDTDEPASGLAPPQSRVVLLAIARLGYSVKSDPIRTWEYVFDRYQLYLAERKKIKSVLS